MMDTISRDGVRRPHHPGWKPHTVRQRYGSKPYIGIDAQFQIVTERWNRVICVPYIVYMPEKDRLLMLVGCDSPARPFVMSSDDHGATWSDLRPVNPEAKGLGTCLTYLGAGRLIFATGFHLWFSSDHGETWEGHVPELSASSEYSWSASNGYPWCWDPFLVDRDPGTGEVTRIVATGFTVREERAQANTCFSTDGGRTWSDNIRVPEWYGVSEVALLRAKDGNIVAAGRIRPAREYAGKIDHYSGLGVSISNDDGKTWSPVDRLYDYGRHHPCMVLMPGGEIVMTYVVRLSYPRDENGFPQFGIEAIVSRDNGANWDIAHRYILHQWVGHLKGNIEWWPSSQATSTILLPDGFLVTAFGTGYRCQPTATGPCPCDVGLVRWQLAVANTPPSFKDKSRLTVLHDWSAGSSVKEEPYSYNVRGQGRVHARITRSSATVGGEQFLAKVEMLPQHEGGSLHTAITLSGFPVTDWSDYAAVAVRVHNPGRESLRIGVTVKESSDYGYDYCGSSCWRWMDCPPGKTITLFLDLEDTTRISLKAIGLMMIHCPAAAESRTFLVGAVCLFK